MTPYWCDGQVTLHLGDCLEVLAGMEPESVDAIVTDPPAGVSFMGRSWDSDRGGRDRWVAWLSERMTAAARCLKPGGHALVWALPRTAHWTAWALEDAGFEIRDSIAHMFGSGFPKSLDVSRAIDKAAGAERKIIAEGQPLRRMIPGADQNRGGSWVKDNGREFVPSVSVPATDDAAEWDGWGTALKPGHEIWWLARKPFTGSVAANVLEHGTGALNIDACRVGAGQDYRDKCASVVGLSSNRNGDAYGEWTGERAYSANDAGRWPPNLLLTHSAGCAELGTRKVRGITGGTGHHGNSVFGKLSYDEGAPVRDYASADGTETVAAWDCVPDCPVSELDRQSGVLHTHGGGERAGRGGESGWRMSAQSDAMPGVSDAGGASRFYPAFRYQAKAGTAERPRLEDGTAHQTVKSSELMGWLCRLITPPGGLILDPFAGSGTTAQAAIVEGFRCALIEKDPAYAELIKVRLSKAIQPAMFGEPA